MLTNETSFCLNCGEPYYYDPESAPEYCAIVCSQGCAEAIGWGK